MIIAVTTLGFVSCWMLWKIDTDGSAAENVAASIATNKLSEFALWWERNAREEIRVSLTKKRKAACRGSNRRATAGVTAGFDPERVLTFQVSASWGETADRRTAKQSVDRILEGLAAVPGVESVAATFWIPGVPTTFPVELTVSEGHVERSLSWAPRHEFGRSARSW